MTAILSVAPFEERHLWNMSISAKVLQHFSRMGFDSVKESFRIAAKPENFSCTLFRDQYPILSTGLILQDKIGYAWAVVDEVQVRPVALTVNKLIRRGLKEIIKMEGLQKINAIVPADDITAQRWAQFFGLEFAEVLPEFEGGYTYYKYERIA
jgi:hypothetical protein